MWGASGVRANNFDDFFAARRGAHSANALIKQDPSIGYENQYR
jgi:hypothetical protein